MTSFNDLRVWGLYDKLIGRIEFLSESKTECEKIRHLYEHSPMIRKLVIIRFDLSPLYYDAEKYTTKK